MIVRRTAFILVAAATLADITGLRSAGAEIYRPWCVQYGGNNGDNGTTCAFTSFEQCMMTARGSGGFCAESVVLAIRQRPKGSGKHGAGRAPEAPIGAALEASLPIGRLHRLSRCEACARTTPMPAL